MRSRCGSSAARRPRSADALPEPQSIHRDRRPASGLSLHDGGRGVSAARAAGGGELPRDAEPQQPHGLYAVGRLKSGVDVTSARAEMQNIAAALALEHPEINKGRSASTSSRSPTAWSGYGANADRARRRRRAAAAHRLRQPGQPAAEPERVARTSSASARRSAAAGGA